MEDELQLSARIAFRWGPMKLLCVVRTSARIALVIVSASMSWIQLTILCDMTHRVHAAEVSTFRILAFGLLGRLGDNISRNSL